MKKIDYPREQLSVRLELELAKAFKIALITRNQTAQAVLEQAVRDYLKSEEGKTMKLVDTHNNKVVREFSNIESLAVWLKSECYDDYSSTFEKWQQVKQNYPEDEEASAIAEAEFRKDFKDNWNWLSPSWNSPKGVIPEYEID